MSEDLAARPSMQEVEFHYIKSDQFRVVHIDGAIGSLTPRGYIHAGLYSERMPIPRSVTQTIKPDGNLGDTVNLDARSGVVREVEISLILDRAAAESLRGWLEKQIAELDRAFAASNTNENKE